MPNYVANKITFASNFNDEIMQKFLSAVLSLHSFLPDTEDEKSPESEPENISLEERCRSKTVEFDFGNLIPMPAELEKSCGENVLKYGYSNWYDWRCANWGTKWNALKTFVNWDLNCITFQTAWSAPEPIMQKISEMFPDVEFEWLYADEDCGYNTGLAVCKEGSFSIEYFQGASHEAYKAYVDCWGENECMYQDSEGNWGRYTCDNCPNPC